MKNSRFSLALITGASSGIGKQLAYVLADQGISLILSGRNEEQLQQLAETLKKKVEVIILPADLSQEKGRQEVVAIIRDLVPDLVINNAGFGLYGEALSYSTDQQLEILEVDGNVVLELTLEAAKALTNKSKTGVILNVSSAIGFQVAPYFAVYAAVKAFVTNFSLALDEELKNTGIRVLAACPGVVKTDFSTRASRAKEKRTPPMSMTVEYTANEIWKQIQKGKALHIFDWRYRLLTFISRLLPQSLVMNSLKRTIKTTRM